MNNESMNLTKVIVPCRFSYLHCWEPNAVNGGDPKYSVSAIIPKSDAETVEKIKRAIEQAKKDSVSKWGGKVPANLKHQWHPPRSQIPLQALRASASQEPRRSA